MNFISRAPIRGLWGNKTVANEIGWMKLCFGLAAPRGQKVDGLNLTRSKRKCRHIFKLIASRYDWVRNWPISSCAVQLGASVHTSLCCIYMFIHNSVATFAGDAVFKRSQSAHTMEINGLLSHCFDFSGCNTECKSIGPRTSSPSPRSRAHLHVVMI